MENQNTEDGMKSNHHLLLKTHQAEDLFLNSAEIDGTLKKLSRFFNDRLGVADRETISFCLRHIFYTTNQMYTLFLPELSNCRMENAGIGKEHFRIYTMPMRNTPVKNLVTQYHIWSLLQEIEAVLERLEPLCQLIISAITNMLNELDRTCSIKHKREKTTQKEQVNPYIHSARENQVQSPDQGQAQQGESGEWERGLAQMRDKMSIWLKSNETYLSFSIQFAILEPMIPALPQLDVAFNALLKSVCAIFGDILPDFQESGTNEDEKATILLLDIIQRCDQILLQIGILAGPLHVLTGQYTLETTIQ